MVEASSEGSRGPEDGRLERWLELMRALGAARSQDEVVSPVLESIAALTQLEVGVLALYEAREEALRLHVPRRARRATETPGATQWVGEGVLGQVFDSGQPVWTRTVPQEPWFDPALDGLGGQPPDALACLPVEGTDGRFGCLLVHGRSDGEGWQRRTRSSLSALAELVGQSLDRIHQLGLLRDARDTLGEHRPDPTRWFEGQTAASLECRARLQRASRSDAPVLFLGPAGVGKEQAARTVHRWSERAQRPFVRVRCSLPGDQVASLLLVGKNGQRAAAERAEGGTLYLERVDVLPRRLQLDLLRRLAGTLRGRPGALDVRLMASLRDAEAASALEPAMRARLQVLEVPVPRLQERREDLPLLAHHALAGAGAGAPADAELSAPALQRLRAWSWPGHLGELRAVLAAARLRAAHGRIQAHHLALPTEPGTRAAEDIELIDAEEETACLRRDVEAYKRARVSGALRESDGNQLLAAERLGLHASNLSRLMKTLGLRD